MKAFSLLLMLILLLLGACDIEREPPLPGPYGDFESDALIFLL